MTHLSSVSSDQDMENSAVQGSFWKCGSTIKMNFHIIWPDVWKSLWDAGLDLYCYSITTSNRSVGRSLGFSMEEIVDVTVCTTWHRPWSSQRVQSETGLSQINFSIFKKIAQHTTPIAKTHRTATLFASEPTERLNMFINLHHQNITTPSPKQHNNITKTSPPHHHTSLRHHQSITDTEQRHHQHKTKASPTYHQNLTTQSPHITKTSLAHAENILILCDTEKSPSYHRNIHETQKT